MKQKSLSEAAITEPETHSCAEGRSSGTVVAVSQAKRNAQLRKAYRKVDLRLLLWYAILFTMVKISTKNVTNAAILNLEQGTGIKHQLGHLTSEQWAWVLSIFSYPYIVFEPVSTILLKRFTPRKWMSRILITWACLPVVRNASLPANVRSGNHLHVPSGGARLRRAHNLPVAPRTR